MKTQTLIEKISLINETILTSFGAKNERDVIANFTEASIKVLDAGFGFSFFRAKEKFYMLYNSSKTPYVPAPPRKDGWVATAFRTKKVQLIQDTKKQIKDHPELMKSVAVIPIVYKSNNYGTIHLCFKKHREFNSQDRTLCAMIGNGAAQAITIYRLYNSVKQERNMLEVRVDERTAELVKTNSMLKQQIAERRQAQRALQASRHFLEQIANVVPGIITVIDLKTANYIYVNDAVTRVLGYAREDFLQGGVNFATGLVHPTDVKALVKKNDDAIEEANTNPDYDDDQIFTFEYRMKNRNGEWRWLNTYGIVFDRDASGKVSTVLNISVDITERKKIEEAMAEDRAKDEALLASMGEGIIATDAEGRIILVNPEAEYILGKKAGDLLGKYLHEAQPILDDHGREMSAQERPIYKVLHRGRPIRAAKSTSVFYKKNNGELVPVSLTATPVIYNNKIIGVVQVFHDITKEKEIDRVKSELISLASHQLRTPLSAINWYAEALMKEEIGGLNKDQKKYMKQIFHANQKMVELVYDFLNVSRIELGTFSIKLSTLNIVELAQGITREIAPIINQKRLRVEEKFGKGLECVQGDRKIIRLILQNLLTNAVKYTPDNGRVKLALALERKNGKKANLLITVADNGYGIPKDQQSKIFTKLFRADNAAKLDAEGSGLGLYLVKSFVEFCGGKISFTSKENKGTTFSVSLPVELVGKQAMAAR